MAFAVGEHIVHPAHGAGKIVSIEDEELIEGFEQYYVIHFAEKRLTVCIPLDRIDDLGLRQVMGRAKSRKVLEALCSTPKSLPSDFKARRQTIETWIQTGQPMKLAQAVRDLAWRRAAIRLNKADTELYDRAHRRLLQELALSTGQSLTEAEQHIAKALAQSQSDQERTGEAAAAD